MTSLGEKDGGRSCCLPFVNGLFFSPRLLAHILTLVLVTEKTTQRATLCTSLPNPHTKYCLWALVSLVALVLKGNVLAK